MTAIQPLFDGYAFTDANFVVSELRSEASFEGRPKKAVLADAGALPEVTLSGRRILMKGRIAGTPSTTARVYLRDLMANLRGSDRTTKGQLDLYGDGHWWAQLHGRPVMQWVEGDDSVNLTLEFYAEDPFRRNNSMISVTATPGSTMDITFGASQDFLGDAPRIPLVINCGPGWSAGDVVRIHNTTAGWRFEKTVVNALSASQDLIINGERCHVTEGNEVVAEGVVCTSYPYVSGGQTNTLDFTGTTTLQSTTCEFFDRFFE